MVSTGAAALLAGAPQPGSVAERPVPVLGEPGPGMPGDYMTYDQRFAATRTDVLVYQTDPLDHDVTIAGPVTPALQVSTSGTDSDFDVKVIDVYPNDVPDYNAPTPEAAPEDGSVLLLPPPSPMAGYQQLIRGEPFRGPGLPIRRPHA